MPNASHNVDLPPVGERAERLVAHSRVNALTPDTPPERFDDEINTARLNRILQPYARSEILRPLAILTLDLTLLGLTIFSALVAESLWARLVLSVFAGFEIGLLFIVGHDSCHGSFTSSRLLNRIIGRIVFLPALHPFSLQYLWHNRTHHRYTNWRVKDFLWAPLSKQEYDRCGPVGRFFYRLYRTWFGHGFYYLNEIWWPKMMFPPRSATVGNRAACFWDRVLVWTWLAFYLALLSWFPTVARRWGFEHVTVWSSLLFGWVIPFQVWNWGMGFLIYQHHTHAKVAWFEDFAEWDYIHAQIQETVHIRFPRALNFMIHNIMEHTAHHAQSQIPMYNLNDAQGVLEETYGPRMINVEWSFREYLQTLRDCKLYDYRTHHWLDFQGRRTSPCTVGAGTGKVSFPRP